MRFTGILRSWNDERDFGFIAATQGGREVHPPRFAVTAEPLARRWTATATVCRASSNGAPGCWDADVARRVV